MAYKRGGNRLAEFPLGQRIAIKTALQFIERGGRIESRRLRIPPQIDGIGPLRNSPEPSPDVRDKVTLVGVELVSDYLIKTIIVRFHWRKSQESPAKVTDKSGHVAVVKFIIDIVAKVVHEVLGQRFECLPVLGTKSPPVGVDFALVKRLAML